MGAKGGEYVRGEGRGERIKASRDSVRREEGFVKDREVGNVR